MPSTISDSGGSANGGVPKMIGNAPLWSMPIVIVAVISGIAIIGSAIWCEIHSSVDATFNLLLVASGLSIVFSAFGSQGTVQFRNFIIAGCGAICIVLFFAVDYVRSNSYAVIDIMTPSNQSPVFEMWKSRLKGESSISGNVKTTRFVIFHKDIFAENLVSVSLSESDKAPRICIEKDKIKPYFGRSSNQIWTVSTDSQEIVDRSSRSMLGSLTDCLQPLSRSSTSSLSNLLETPWIATAYAQLPTGLSAEELQIIFDNLASDETDIRRLTRQQVATLAPSASIIRPLMDEAIRLESIADRKAYRLKVGTVSIIVNLLQAKRVTEKDVRQTLTTADLQAIARWSVDTDASLRIPSAQILSQFADIQILQELLPLSISSNNPDVIYNTAWILSESTYRFKNDKTALVSLNNIVRELRPYSNGPKTSALLDNISR